MRSVVTKTGRNVDIWERHAVVTDDVVSTAPAIMVRNGDDDEPFVAYLIPYETVSEAQQSVSPDIEKSPVDWSLIITFARPGDDPQRLISTNGGDAWELLEP